jgi:hypothetical protein
MKGRTRIRESIKKPRGPRILTLPSSARAIVVGVGLILVAGACAPSGGGMTEMTLTSSTRGTPQSTQGPCEKSSSIEIPQATPEELKAAGLDKLPLAPLSDRVDLVAPPFTNSTSVTNPLFPISDLHSAVLNGDVDGKPFKTETTLLPETRVLEWTDGQCVETLVSQYVAYSNGRIKEVALDLYAQADDGSVWYLGEDVFNYDHGIVNDTEGTWFAGREGPVAMIMPNDPRVGEAFLPENIPGLVFEEVTVKSINQTVEGPHGLVEGAIVTEELHQDGSFEEKIFAPGYGEFFTGSGGDREALALAVPTDALAGPAPKQLELMFSGAKEVLAAMRSHDWKSASSAANAMTSAWNDYRKTGDVPTRLGFSTNRALKGLTKAIAAHQPVPARQSAIEVGHATLDLQLQYRPPSDIDLARFDLWARRVVVDAAAGNAAGVAGDVATLEWIRDRIVSRVDDVSLIRIDVGLVELRNNSNDGDLRAAAGTARNLSKIVANL